jgi:hypothetical protein
LHKKLYISSPLRGIHPEGLILKERIKPALSKANGVKGPQYHPHPTSPLPSPERLAFAEALAQAGYAQAGIKGEVIIYME